MGNIINIISMLKQMTRELQELQLKEVELRRRLPGEEAQMSQKRLEEEAQLKQLMPQAEVRFNKLLEQSKAKAVVELATIASYTKLASQKANEEAPRLLREEWTQQQQLLADMMHVIDGVTAASEECPPRLISLPWGDRLWSPSDREKNSYRPQTSGLAPGVLRIGELQQLGTLPLEELQPRISIPAFVPIRALSTDPASHTPGHIAIFSNSADSRQAAVEAIQSIALRVISTFPVKKVRGVFIDPVGMGNNFPFKSLPEIISGPRTYTRSDDVREQLRELTLKTEQVIQKYLSTDYQTIEEYNSAKSFIKEPYRYLFVADFPTNFDNTSWEDLKSLLINGARAGVYVVLHIDETLEKPRNFNYGIFNSSCTVLHPSDRNYQRNQLFSMNLPNNLACKVILDRPPANEQFNQITEAITKATKEVKTETIPFTELYPPKMAEWSFDSREEMRAPIGITGATDYIEFWMGNNEDGKVTSQGLLAGKPGAGKSYTLHAIITSLAMRYSPDELEMYLLDFKEGVEFQIYVDPERSESANLDGELNETKALPHAKVVSIESDREFGLSVLKYIQRELEDRGSKFRAAGVSSLKDYRNRSQEKMPRILVVIDEFQYMFQENDDITRQLNIIFDDITRRGRAFGVHLLIASQSPSVPNMSGGIYSFIDLRMAQQMDKKTAASVLAEGNIDAVDLLEGPGEIIYNSQQGKKGYNTVGQIADMSATIRRNALLQIQSVAGDKHYKRPEPLILFNGTQATKLNRNRQLIQLSGMSNWLPLRELNKQVIQQADWSLEETPGVAWLGEAMRIGNHTQAIFRRRPRSNMLLIGTSEETIFGILGGILISLVHCRQPNTVQFRIMDLSQQDEENHQGKMLVSFRDTFGKYFPVSIGKRFPNPEDKIQRAEDILQQTYAEFERRKKLRDDNPNEMNLGQSLFFVCAIGSLSRAQHLRPIMGSRNEEPSPDAKNLITLLSQGPELGIHTILWLESMKTFLKMTAENRSSLTHFDLRIGLTMPGDDSRSLFGETSAQNLPRLRAYFHDEAAAAGLEKFKPYAVPSVQEITGYGHRFKQRSL